MRVQHALYSSVVALLLSLTLSNGEIALGRGELPAIDRSDDSSRIQSADPLVTALRDKLRSAESTIDALQRNLGSANAEAEIFRRQASELKIRLEAMGSDGSSAALSKIEQRLLKAVGDIKLLQDERDALQTALIQLSEAVLAYQKIAVTSDADARVALETEMRGAFKALGTRTSEGAETAAAPATLVDGMVISLRKDLALVVANIGSRQGVSVGMPFRVVRGDSEVGLVRVVDVREKISGAVIQELATGAGIQVGDQLRVGAQQ